MVGKGAKYIVLLSRSGSLKGRGKDQINALNEAGANIVVRRCDVVDQADVAHLVSHGLTDMPPVRGVIHGAMVLHVSGPLKIHVRVSLTAIPRTYSLRI